MQQHAATFFAKAEDAAGADLPQFVEHEFDAFLECAILVAHGYLQTAARLLDHAIFHVPVRQWMLSLPIALRLLLAAQPQPVDPCCSVRRVATRFLLRQAGMDADEADSGVGHAGIDGPPEFVDVPETTDEALRAVLHKIITRLMKLPTRREVLVEEDRSRPTGPTTAAIRTRPARSRALRADDRRALAQRCRNITRPAPSMSVCKPTPPGRWLNAAGSAGQGAPSGS